MSEKDKNQLNELAAEYQKQEISFFNSFEEMNEAQYAHWRSLTPVQRLAEHYSLLIRVYNYKDEYSPYDKIYFD